MRISDWSSDVCSSDLVTLVKPGEADADATAEQAAASGDDERAEILRKLEESRLRNLTEQQRLAEEDKRRVEEAAERKRKEEEEAERLRVEAETAAAAAAVADRKSVVEGKSGSVSVDLGGPRNIKKKKKRAK